MQVVGSEHQQSGGPCCRHRAIHRTMLWSHPAVQGEWSGPDPRDRQRRVCQTHSHPTPPPLLSLTTKQSNTCALTDNIQPTIPEYNIANTIWWKLTGYIEWGCIEIKGGVSPRLYLWQWTWTSTAEPDIGLKEAIAPWEHQVWARKVSYNSSQWNEVQHNLWHNKKKYWAKFVAFKSSRFWANLLMPTTYHLCIQWYSRSGQHVQHDLKYHDWCCQPIRSCRESYAEVWDSKSSPFSSNLLDKFEMLIMSCGYVFVWFSTI